MSGENQPIDRRYQIFISSTFTDLQQQRKQAIEVIADLKHIPIALERFAAQKENDLDLIQKVMSQCQIYLLILGPRYGELVPPKYEISYTELEYNLALKNNLEILVLQMHPDEIMVRRSHLKDEVEHEKKERYDNQRKLEHFHIRLVKHHRQFWKTEDHDFKYHVLKALTDNLPKCQKRGFIPEPEDPTFVDAAANEFIVDLVNELRGFETLYSRVSEEAEKKRALAKCFRERYANRIVEDHINLFFESGSTVAYVAKDLATALADAVHISPGGAPNIKINTNNVLAYLLFWLKMRILCSPFSWSTPSEKKFGAWYGGLGK